MATSPKKRTSTEKPRAARSRSASAARSADRADKSVEAFRSALERSVTLSRERIQEVVDDAVKRGRMTRGDANELVSKLVARGRRQSEELAGELERLLGSARGEVETRTERARRQADRIRRRAGVGSSFPISGYDDLTAAQISARLGDLTKPELRRVRTHERNNKARKGILGKIDAKLG